MACGCACGCARAACTAVCHARVWDRSHSGPGQVRRRGLHLGRARLRPQRPLPPPEHTVLRDVPRRWLPVPSPRPRAALPLEEERLRPPGHGPLSLSVTVTAGHAGPPWARRSRGSALTGPVRGPLFYVRAPPTWNLKSSGTCSSGSKIRGFRKKTQTSGPLHLTGAQEETWVETQESHSLLAAVCLLLPAASMLEDC